MDANPSMAYEGRGGQQYVFPSVSESECALRVSGVRNLQSPRVVAALRAENRDGGVILAAVAKLLEVFCPKSERWRQAVLHRGSDVTVRAQALLGQCNCIARRPKSRGV